MQLKKERRGREKYGSVEREGERNCSFQGLAAFQAVWLWFCWPLGFCGGLTSRLTGPRGCLSLVWSKLSKLYPLWLHLMFYSCLKKKQRSVTHVISASLVQGRQRACQTAGILSHTHKNTLWHWHCGTCQKGCSQDGVSFFVFSLQRGTGTAVEISPVEIGHIFFYPTGNGVRLETFLVGQWAIKDPSNHSL